VKKEKLTERLQVLLSAQDLQDLQTILNQAALENNTKPETTSGFLRRMAKEFINKNKK
jgi:hypothetical protein